MSGSQYVLNIFVLLFLVGFYWQNKNKDIKKLFQKKKNSIISKEFHFNINIYMIYIEENVLVFVFFLCRIFSYGFMIDNFMSLFANFHTSKCLI